MKETDRLSKAAKDRYRDSLQALLQEGVDINALDEYGETILHHAVITGDARAVRLLLEHGANVHARGENAGTVLQSAAWLGSVETVQLLLDYGAAQDPQDAQLALRNCFFDNGQAKAPLLIAAGARMGLIEAIHAHDIDLVRRLLDEGTDPNDSRENYTPLMHAISSDNPWNKVDMIDLLIERGADVNAIGAEHETALLLAISSGISEWVFYFLDHGADINLSIGTVEPPLMRAIACFPKIVNDLIKRGADVNVGSETGGTPLQLALERGDTKLADRLRQAGAR
jgi:cytohesin